MAFENFPEVWAALGRLYDSLVEMQKQQAQANARFDAKFEAMSERIDRLAASMGTLTEHVDTLTERVDRVVATVATLAGTVGQMASMIDSHERRLQRLEGQ
ncbi:MAG TPA: hypothetical protein VLV47_00910 [Candidatus Bathyarchaeia archaeon]|nr:hypothetical protein [Candidatus Bathyarchaeia archaeon]